MRRPPVRTGVGFFNAQSAYTRPLRQPRLFREILAQARHAEELGYDSLWVGEHHFAYDGYCPAPIPLQAHAAAATSTISLGVGIMVLPLRRPAEVARQCAAFAEIAPGRLRLSVAVGYAQLEFLAHRAELRGRGRRLEMLLDELLADHDEQFGQTELWMGGNVEAVARRAGRYGASMFLSPHLAPPEVKTLREIWQAELQPRPGQTPRVAINFPVLISTDRSAVEAVRRQMREARKIYDLYFEEPKPWARFEGLGREGWLDAMAAFLVSGSPDEVTERIAAFVEAGVDDVIFELQWAGVAHEDVMAKLERLAEQVVPRLAARPAA